MEFMIDVLKLIGYAGIPIVAFVSLIAVGIAALGFFINQDILKAETGDEES